ncbi:YMD3-like protein [Mya arenaria]|uniref:YMD3-like protein n=1 Tax=Mya arenaria TaxID=6604 RepID=A0ABY7G0P8_MYAAR|nr:YMD3-like protein [Mya arenaria]
MTLARQIYPGHCDMLLKQFAKATKHPYGHLLTDSIVEEPSPENMDKGQACDDCGQLFDITHEVQRNVKNSWCPEYSESKKKNEDMSDSEQDDSVEDNEAYVQLWKKVRETNGEKFQKIYNTFIDHGEESDEAQEIAEERIQPYNEKGEEEESDDDVSKEETENLFEIVYSCSDPVNMAPWKDYLKSIYYYPKHTAVFAGPQKLHDVVKKEGKFKIGMHWIRQFLHDQESHSLHKPVRRRFQRNHVVSVAIDDVWMADLIDMVIDTFSKYVWLKPLKYKTGEEVAQAFQKIFTTTSRSPAKLITDKARKVQDLMKKEEIQYFSTQNENKASTLERAILTIKTSLTRYIWYKETATFITVLQDIADN